MEKVVIVEGQMIPKDLYDFFLTGFKESFAYSSLSVESAFEKLEDCEAGLKQIRDELSYEYYKCLDSIERCRIDAFLRRFIVFRGFQYGVIPGTMDPNCPQKEVDANFGRYFKYMAKEMHYFMKFDENGKFDERATFKKIGDMFSLAFCKKKAYDEAYNMKKDHLNAFDYAMSLDNIGVPEIIRINEIVNNSNPDKEEGFKKMNNIITGSSIKVADKTSVPFEMQKLLAEYRNNFGLEILDYRDPTLSYKEKRRRILKICEREALFHIRFERIHPFADGNGRTGRIIMNKHLIDEQLAPVLFTDYTSEAYRKCIEDFDYESLAKIMADSSSQLLSNWISMNRAGIRPGKADQSNDDLAYIGNSFPKRKKLFYH